MSDKPIRPPNKRVTLPKLAPKEEIFPDDASVPPELHQQPADAPADTIRCADTPPAAGLIGRNKVSAVSEAVTLQYANGKSMARATIGSGRFTPLVGFHIEVGKDSALDEAMGRAGFQQIE